MDFGTRLEQTMRARRLSASEVARTIGVSRQAVLGIVRGAEPRLSTYARLVAAYPELRIENGPGAA
jgi:transcriptional regulator with XRE-family HTH domain